MEKFLQRIFGFDKSTMSFKKEALAGVTTFLTMAYTWQFALTAVLIEGLIFILMTLVGLRQKMVECLVLK